MAEKFKENIIYFPEGEGDKEKQAAKDYEKEHLQSRGYAPSIEDDPEKFKESKPSRVSKRETENLVKIAEEMKKGSVGIGRREMKDWWLGKEGGRGAKDLAETVFNYFLGKINALEHKGMEKLVRGETAERNFVITKEIKNLLDPLARGIIQRGAEEDILLYFMDEWRPAVIPDVRKKIWRIFQEYLKEFSGKNDISDSAPKEKNKETGVDKKEMHPEPDHRLYAISKEEAMEWVKDVEKVMGKKIGGAPRGEFKKWWLGEKGGGMGDGARELAEWVFDQISHDDKENFMKNIEPSLNRLIEEIVRHGAQEDIWQYFWEEWALKYSPQISEKVWEVYKNSFDKMVEKI